MKVLVLGAGGMLGHKLVKTLQAKGYETFGTLRGSIGDYPEAFSKATILQGVDAMDFDRVRMAVDAVRPDAIVNCIGVIKQRTAAKDAVPSITLNALLPHRLAELGPRLIHFSTDCVFRGDAGPYRVCSLPDATDLYGRTKAMGEVVHPNAVTLRTSIVGRELTQFTSLVEWFLAQNGPIKGFTNALYSGMTTGTMADLVCEILDHHPSLWGLYQATSDAISKHDLLVLLNEAFEKGLSIEADDAFHCDRRMDGSHLEEAIGWKTPKWTVQIAGLSADRKEDEAWR